MSLKDTLQRDLTAAVRSGDAVRKRTLRLAMSLIHSAEARDATPENPVARDLPDSEILDLLRDDAKRRRQAIQAYISAGHEQRADTELAEVAVLETYLGSRDGLEAIRPVT